MMRLPPNMALQLTPRARVQFHVSPLGIGLGAALVVNALGAAERLNRQATGERS